MEWETLIELYPAECLWFVDVGVNFVLLVLCFFSVLGFFMDLTSIAVARRRDSARCLGFQRGQISGVCRNHNCPYGHGCSFYAPRRSFKDWLSDLRKKGLTK